MVGTYFVLTWWEAPSHLTGLKKISVCLDIFCLFFQVPWAFTGHGILHVLQVIDYLFHFQIACMTTTPKSILHVNVCLQEVTWTNLERHPWSSTSRSFCERIQCITEIVKRLKTWNTKFKAAAFRFTHISYSIFGLIHLLSKRLLAI